MFYLILFILQSILNFLGMFAMLACKFSIVNKKRGDLVDLQA